MSDDYRQYTRCCRPEDWTSLANYMIGATATLLTVAVVTIAIAGWCALFYLGVAAAAEAVAACTWWLNKRLVCLGGDRSAVGMLVAIEPAVGKSGYFGELDTDYSINLLLYPNLPGVSQTLKFTPDALAGIFLGEIKKWNDPAIAQANAGVTLPDAGITVVHRSDGSGTTFIWVDYLSKVSKRWESTVGRGTSVSWPVGIGGKGNEGVAGSVKQTPNSIGYVELIYALQQKLPAGLVQNATGRFVEAGLESVSKAAEGVTLAPDLRVSITNSDNPEAYPISGFTWILVYQEMSDAKKALATTRFLWWAIHDGQKFAKDLGYAPLPKDVVTKTEAKITSVTSSGKPALPRP
jgi:phosphate ABC transporter phosphate-binding protein